MQTLGPEEGDADSGVGTVRCLLFGKLGLGLRRHDCTLCVTQCPLRYVLHNQTDQLRCDEL